MAPNGFLEVLFRIWGLSGGSGVELPLSSWKMGTVVGVQICSHGHRYTKHVHAGAILRMDRDLTWLSWKIQQCHFNPKHMATTRTGKRETSSLQSLRDI